MALLKLLLTHHMAKASSGSMAFHHLRSTFAPLISLDSSNNPVKSAGINFLMKSLSVHQSFNLQGNLSKLP